MQSHRDPVTNHFLGGGTVIEHMEGEIIWNEAVKMIGLEVAEPFDKDKVADLLVGDWTATGTITGEGDTGVLKVGDKFTMVGSFQLAAGGKAIVGTQKLTVLDRPNVSADCSVQIAWDPVDLVVRIAACWSDGSVEIGGLSSIGVRRDCVRRRATDRCGGMRTVPRISERPSVLWLSRSLPFLERLGLQRTQEVRGEKNDRKSDRESQGTQLLFCGFVDGLDEHSPPIDLQASLANSFCTVRTVNSRLRSEGEVGTRCSFTVSTSSISTWSGPSPVPRQLPGGTVSQPPSERQPE